VVAFRPEKIEEGIVGSSERNLEQFWEFCIVLAPTLILFDEIDQTNVSRRGTNSGNPVASNLFNQMLDRMSDETLRGQIVGLFASNRPDLIDPALLRFGRMDAIIPFLLPEADERCGVLLSQAAMQGVKIEPDALTRLTDGTEGATYHQSIRYPQSFKLVGNALYLPKVGWVAVVLHRPLEGKPKNCTVSKTRTGNYYVSLQCEVSIPNPIPLPGKVGIDLGLKDFATLSTGEKIAPPKHLRRAERRLLIRQVINSW
jgi:hypothetical protein